MNCLQLALFLKNIFMRHCNSHRDSFHIYTDGSKDATGASSAYVHGQDAFFVRIPSVASIFTTELYAAYHALNYYASLPPSPVTLFIDSRSIQAVVNILL